MEFLSSVINSLDILVVVALVSMFIFMAFYRRMETKNRWVTIVIMVYTLGELVALVMAGKKIHNQWFYGLMLVPQLILVTSTLKNGMMNRTTKMVMMGGSIVLSLAHLINMRWFEGADSMCLVTYIPAVTWLAVCSFLYLREQINNHDAIPFNSLLSWFALATLIDNAATMPILTSLSWPSFANSKFAYDLFDIVQMFYIGWFLLNVTGLLWTQTSLKLRFSSR